MRGEYAAASEGELVNLFAQLIYGSRFAIEKPSGTIGTKRSDFCVNLRKFREAIEPCWNASAPEFYLHTENSADVSAG